jgi:hypothetical protein
MRVINHHKSALGSFNLSIQCLNLPQGPGLVVKDEVLVILSVIEIGPKHINWESILSKLGVAVNH